MASAESIYLCGNAIEFEGDTGLLAKIISLNWGNDCGGGSSRNWDRILVSGYHFLNLFPY